MRDGLMQTLNKAAVVTDLSGRYKQMFQREVDIKMILTILK